MIRTLLESIVPALCGVFIGSWSDHYGRKPLLVISMIGTEIHIYHICMYVRLKCLFIYVFLCMYVCMLILKFNRLLLHLHHCGGDLSNSYLSTGEPLVLRAGCGAALYFRWKLCVFRGGFLFYIRCYRHEDETL